MQVEEGNNTGHRSQCWKIPYPFYKSKPCKRTRTEIKSNGSQSFQLVPCFMTVTDWQLCFGCAWHCTAASRTWAPLNLDSQAETHTMLCLRWVDAYGTGGALGSLGISTAAVIDRTPFLQTRVQKLRLVLELGLSSLCLHWYLPHGLLAISLGSPSLLCSASHFNSPMYSYSRETGFFQGSQSMKRQHALSLKPIRGSSCPPREDVRFP